MVDHKALNAIHNRIDINGHRIGKKIRMLALRRDRISFQRWFLLPANETAKKKKKDTAEDQEKRSDLRPPSPKTADGDKSEEDWQVSGKGDKKTLVSLSLRHPSFDNERESQKSFPGTMKTWCQQQEEEKRENTSTKEKQLDTKGEKKERPVDLIASSNKILSER